MWEDIIFVHCLLLHPNFPSHFGGPVCVTVLQDNTLSDVGDVGYLFSTPAGPVFGKMPIQALCPKGNMTL